MRRSIRVFVFIIFTFLVVVPPAAFSEVKIFLKNGRDIMADSCRDSSSRLICQKMGGTFEINKKDILRVSGIRTEKKLSVEEEVADASGEVKKDETPVIEALASSSRQETEISETNDKGKVVRGIDPEAEKRLDEIHERKLQLSRQAEEINRERQQLKEDMQKAPNMLTDKQFDDLNKRNIAIESSISSFNEQLRSLKTEEIKIIEEQKAR